jgi:DNA-binding SARP family transcriptional activator
VLLLSLVEALMGDNARAYALAQEGIALGKKLESPFITAVGYMRLGHAIQLGADSTDGASDEATGRYRQAIALGDRLAVRRTRAEAMWGLTRAYGYGGDLTLASTTAAEGMEIASESGDVWLLALSSLALGASHVLAGEYTSALPILGRALSAFRECSDTFGRAAARLWMALVHLELARSAGMALDTPLREASQAARGSEQGALRHFLTSTQELLAICETNGYDFLFTRPSLLGPPDERRLAPLLLAARAHTIRPAYVARLLAVMGIPDIKVHPGYQLRVQTLGGFRVWRGSEEIAAREWQRDKARQLFQLLLAERSADEGSRGAQEQVGGRWLQREQIVERLWPNLSPDAAARDFKVALNALVRALEPPVAASPAGSARVFYFVERDGTAYRLRPEADLRLDAVEFEAHCKQGMHAAPDDEALAALRAAFSLYAGDFLPDALYEEWTEGPRARLLTLYLRAADRLADALVARGLYDEAIEVCETILTHDNCWEHAWQLLITAWARQGNRAQARRTCARCAEVLRAELDVPPSDETLALCNELGSPVPSVSRLLLL